jgi:LmbE family N-acetylglucosaminyl deacetylase
MVARPMNVLAIGAHPDDVELGCGGALLGHVERGDAVTLLVLTRGERGVDGARSRIHEQQRAAALLGARLCWGRFTDGEVPTDARLISTIDDVIAETGATLVYTHSPIDTHQDHRATASATLAAARRTPSVLFYETPSTQDFRPAVFVDLSAPLEHKLRLIRAHESQLLRDGPVDIDALTAQARFRGSQCRRHYAEAFQVSRLLWDLAPGTNTSADLQPPRSGTERVEVVNAPVEQSASQTLVR